MKKLIDFRKHPLTYTALSIVALFVLTFAVLRGNYDIRRSASEPVVQSIDMSLGEVAIVYCRGERFFIEPNEFDKNNNAQFTCLGSLVDTGDPDIRETGGERFIIMSPNDITNLSCQGQLESFTLKEGVGYQVFCN